MTPEVVSKLSPEDKREWDIELAGTLKPEEIQKMKPEDARRIRVDLHSGTAFIVFVTDDRAGKDNEFQYLVTNRHVIEPGVEKGKTCDVLQYTLALNHKGVTPTDPIHVQTVNIGPSERWYESTDRSVDLAVIPVMLPMEQWDYESIPISNFVTEDMIERNEIAEGYPVVFAGMFIQYVGGTKLEPVVRSGTIAMLPDDKVMTTLGVLGHIFLAEAHAFEGNSGSPMFVDIDKFKNSLGWDYRLLGVVTGEVFESNDFTLQVSTSFGGTVHANSNISVIVPAEEIQKILDSADLKKLRDDAIAKLGSTTK
jgi:hypothetical protein